MHRIHLYLPSEIEQDALCERWKHVLRNIQTHDLEYPDRQFIEIRIYEEGADFKKQDVEHALPFCMEYKPNDDVGKKRSFESMYKKYIINTGIVTDGYIPKH